ncbi:MAG: malto-oligosyltrehalose synthase, partial [Alphaproteobacteria bacterium]|nr:malto-oligosyltrehalose synthase [Alphaproteobacteria bacterium]
ARRRACWPQALSATSTHDTKRGEDTRARIAVLSEMPTIWRADVTRWHEATADLRRALPDGESPGADVEWLLYQSLLGIWPADLDVRDAVALTELAERLEEFVVKALREAKQRTSWTAPNTPFEESVGAFVRGLLAVDRQELLRDLEGSFQPVLAGGFVNSLAQTALKLTLPGVPDIYQGTELPDLSLVDPDNRRAVDFEQRAELLAEPQDLSMQGWRQGLPKFRLLARLLDLRRDRPALFRDGSYRPLFAQGPMAEHIVAFARLQGDECCVTIIPRLPLSLLGGRSVPLLRPDALDGTEIDLPMAGLQTLDGTTLPARMALGPLLADFPVQVLTTAGTKPAE